MCWVAALHDHRPKAVGMVGQDFLGHNVARYQTADDRRSRDWRTADFTGVTEQWTERRVQVLPTAFGEIAGQDPQQLVQIRTQRTVRGLLNSKVFEHRDAV